MPDYRANDGSIHGTEEGARQANSNSMATADAGAAGLMKIFGPFIVLIVGIIFLKYMVLQYGFYFVPIVIIYLALVVIGATGAVKKGFKPLLVIIAAGIVSCLFGKFIYYPNVIEPSPFTTDYIVSETALHAGRNGKGRERAALAEGEKVTVNGVSRDRAEFNITTAAGIQGWIPAAAFPADANIPRDKVSSLVNPFGIQKYLYRERMKQGDRDWRNAVEAVGNNYFTSRREGTVLVPLNAAFDKAIGWPLTWYVAELTDKAMAMAKTINQPFTATEMGWKEKEGDWELTLAYAVYAPEVTIFYVDYNESGIGNFISYARGKSEKAYFDSLVLKDLDTGETFRPYNIIEGIVENKTHGAYLLFPPIKTSRFALIHETPIKNKAKSVTLWDIPEVTVGAAAAPPARSPEEIARSSAAAMQQRIADFKSDGTNAITKEAVKLYPAYKDYYTENDEALTVIPQGEIVGIPDVYLDSSETGKNRVQYNGFDGYVFGNNLKK